MFKKLLFTSFLILSFASPAYAYHKYCNFFCGGGAKHEKSLPAGIRTDKIVKLYPAVSPYSFEKYVFLNGYKGYYFIVPAGSYGRTELIKKSAATKAYMPPCNSVYSVHTGSGINLNLKLNFGKKNVNK
jgi:hypothetical protein